MKARVPEGSEEAESLHKTCDSFAKWRWNTISKVARDLDRMETAVRKSTASLEAREFTSRGGEWYGLFLDAVRTDVFWVRLRIIDTLSTVTCRFSAWLRRCACHEAESKQILRAISPP